MENLGKIEKNDVIKRKNISIDVSKTSINPEIW